MKHRLSALAIIALFVLVAWRGIVFAPGHVYQNWDNGLPPFSQEVRRYGEISHFAWNPLFDLGSPGAFGGIDRWFDDLVREAAAPLGGPVLAKWNGPVYALIGAAGILALAEVLGLSFLPGLVAGLLYACNPRAFSLAISGHNLEVGFALALLPWVLLLLSRAARAASRRLAVAQALGAGLLGALVCSASPFGIVFFGAFTGLFTLAGTLALKNRRPALALALAGLVVVILHLSWIVPAGESLARGGAAVKYHQTSREVDRNYQGMYRHFSAPLRQAALGVTDNYGMGTEYAYPENTRDHPVWLASAVGLLLLALLGLVFRPRRPRRLRDRGLEYFAGFCLLAGFVCMAGSNTLAGAVFYEKVLARVPMVFDLMARPARWLPIYYTGLALLAGLGLQAVLDQTLWRPARGLSVAAQLAVLALLAVYLEPYWAGSLTTPQNATTQTMALMSQPVSPAEGRLVAALSRDPADYRVTVWPTIAGPTGNVPAPPKSAITRNFAMLGKDAVMGPTFMGADYGRFLLGLQNRPWPYTDRFGRLLGLAAVKRVIFDPTEPYLSYGPYGWMPAVKRGPETLFDPGDLLAAFVAGQTDLAPDPGLVAPPVRVLRNADFLPRLRLVDSARLASGGLPTLVSLADGPGDDFARQAFFFGADLSPADISRLGDRLTGAVVGGGSWPELLLPFLPAEAWMPATSAQAQGTFAALAGQWSEDPRFDGSALFAGGRVSEGPGSLSFGLIGSGEWRLFACLGARPFAGPVTVSLDGERLASLQPGRLGKGPDWLDLGTAAFEPGPPHGLTVAATGRGAVVVGVLAVPESDFQAARHKLVQRLGGRVSLVAEAEEVAGAGAGGKAMEPRVSLPLLADDAGVSVSTDHVRIQRDDPMGAGAVIAEGNTPGEVRFTVTFPTEVSGFTLQCYPRLFGDKTAPSFVETAYSLDGGDFIPLGRIEGQPDGRWEDVYGRQFKKHISAKGRVVTVRFRLRQAQLTSQVNSPNLPMRLVADTPVPGGAVLSFGAATRLPADFRLSLPGAGRFRLTARVVGRSGDAVGLAGREPVTLVRDGATWIDGGEVSASAAGEVRVHLDGPAEAACDQLVLRPAEPGEASPAVAGDSGRLTYRRVNPGRYDLDLPAGPAGLLVFSESFAPGWRLHLGGKDLAPLQGLGFLNAFPLPAHAAEKATLVYQAEAVMERWLWVSRAGWVVFGLALLVLLVLELSRRWKI